MSIVRNSVWSAGSALILGIGRVALNAIVAHKMPQDVFGAFSYGQWLIELSVLVGLLGATNAGSRFIAEYSDQVGKQYSFYKAWSYCSYFLPPLVGAVLFLLAQILGGYEINNSLIFLAAWGVVNACCALQNSLLVGLRRFDLLFISNFITAIFSICGVYFLDQRSDVADLFALMMFSNFASYFYVRLKRPELSKAEGDIKVDWRSVMAFSINVWLSFLGANLVWSRGEFPIIQAALGDGAIASYAAALTVFGAASQVLMLGLSGVGAHVNVIWGQGLRQEAVTLSRSIMNFQLFIGAVFAISIDAFSSVIMKLIFSDKYMNSSDTLSIIAYGLVAFSISSQSQLLQLKTNARFNRNVIMFGIGILYIFAAIAIPKIGIAGAAFARLITTFFVAATTIFFVVKYFGNSAVRLRYLCMISVVLISSRLAFWWEGDDLRRFGVLTVMNFLLVLVYYFECRSETPVVRVVAFLSKLSGRRS